MQVKTITGMNVLDACIVTAGSIEDFIAFAKLNHIGLTDDLPGGITLQGTGLKYQTSSGYQNPVSDSKDVVSIMVNQVMLDIAMQESGNIEDVFKIAKMNGISVTGLLAAGTIVITPTTPYNKKIYQQYRDNGWRPASNVNQSSITVPGLQGIDYWAIELDFILN
jgi:hypothetical protein